MAARTGTYFRCPDYCLESLLVRITILQSDIHHRTQRSPSVGWKGSGIETDFPDQVRVQYADRSPGCSLGSEMIDVRNLDTIDEKGILRGASSPDYQIIAIADRRIGDTGIRTDDTGDVLVGSRDPVNVSQTDDTYADRAFHAP